MDIFRYIVRFLYRIRWYLIVLPLIALAVAWFLTRNMERQYDVSSSIYTGMVTGYNIEGGSGIAGGNAEANLNNLILIITTHTTLEEVSLRLFGRCMMYGNPNKDNNYISAEHFRQLKASVPADVAALIDHNSEATTYANLKAYMKPTQGNYLYGIMNYNQWFGVNQISSKLKVMRVGRSDIIDIAYSQNDPGIAYNTVDILNEAFIRQYQDIRFGETNKVIKFFENEVRRLYRTLCESEDDLIKYNVDKRIINYSEQTKDLSNMESAHVMNTNQNLVDYTTTKALMDYLERQLGNRAKVIRANRQFTDRVNEISKIQSRISNLKLMNSEGEGYSTETQEELAKAQRQLQQTTDGVKELTREIEASSYSTETGVKANDMIDKWLDQVLLYEKTKAEMTAENILGDKINERFRYFSPIGAILSRKGRHVSLTEASYMEMLKALNAARLRQRNLQMTTATLRVLNPPLFPLNALPTNRLMILLGSMFLTFMLTALYFLVIELLDRTLRDRMRSERITKVPVLGCFPQDSNLRYRRFNKTISDMALRQLSKTLLPKFTTGQQNVLNMLSTDSGNGKSYLATELENYWVSLGLQVRRLTYDEDFLADDSRFVMAKDIKDLCPDIMPNEIAIVEYPELNEHPIPSALLNIGTVNLLITRSNRTWKDVDQKALNELKSQLEKQESLFMYLTEASRYAVEEFVGQLPPYTKFNNFVYRISQLGLTATENSKAK